jgi:hypothetical protein
MLFVLLVRAGLWLDLTRARDLILDSAPFGPRAGPIRVRSRAMPPRTIPARCSAAVARLSPGYAALSRLRTSLLFRLSPANVYDATFACPLLELAVRLFAVRLFAVRPRLMRLDAGYRGLKLIDWIYTPRGAQAGIPWNPKR